MFKRCHLKVTFVPATYPGDICPNKRYILAVTGPILTKLFGPNLYGVIISVCSKMFLDKTFSRPKILLWPKVFKPENLKDPKNILNSNFFQTKIFFKPINCFSDPKCFLTHNLFSINISGPKINFAPQFFFLQKFL